MSKQLSPYGCNDCKHAFVDRCALTGHRLQWKVNAKHHCQQFALSRDRVVSCKHNQQCDGDKNAGRKD